MREGPDVCYQPVDAATWPDLVRLFETRGGPKYCWCLLWREPYAVRKTLDLEGRRATMENRVSAGVPIGLLAYSGGESVGWCSIAPRATYVAMGGEDYGPDASVWAIACFYVQRRQRGRDVARGLLRAALDLAATNGAEIVEAYPVDRDSPSYQYMGSVPVFEAAGFVETGRVGTRRHVMHLALPVGD